MARLRAALVWLLAAAPAGGAVLPATGPVASATVLGAGAAVTAVPATAVPTPFSTASVPVGVTTTGSTATPTLVTLAGVEPAPVVAPAAVPLAVASLLARDVTDVADEALKAGLAAAPTAATAPPVSVQRQAYLSAAELGVSAAQGGRRKGPSNRVGYLDLQGQLDDPLAVCNECARRAAPGPAPPPLAWPEPCCSGSPASYYFRKGVDSSNWLVYLEGGMWCYSEATCFVRNVSTPWEMSSVHLAPQIALGGIFETSKKNPWADANVAYVPYCSSDAWIGDVGASDATWGWAFRGQRIVAAVLASLVRTQGLGLHTGLGVAATAQRLLFGGCSAGARGAMMTLDYVADMLADVGITAAQVTVAGLLDSPLWVDVAPAQPHIVPLSNETRAVYALVNASGRLGPGCEAAYPLEEDRWMCLFGQYRMPMLLTPYMLNAAQDDKFELPYNLGGTTSVGYDVQSWHPNQLAYAQAFGPQVLAVVNTLPTASQKRSAVFSTACFRHCVTDSAAFWNVAVAPPPPAGGSSRPQAPVSLADAASAWYFGRVAQPYRVVQQCTGFRCGNCSTKLAKSVLRASGGRAAFGPAGVPRRRFLAALTLCVLVTCCGTCVVLSFAGATAAKEAATAAERRRDAPAPGFRPVLGFKNKPSNVARPGVRYGQRGETTPLLD